MFTWQPRTQTQLGHFLRVTGQSVTELGMAHSWPDSFSLFCFLLGPQCHCSSSWYQFTHNHKFGHHYKPGIVYLEKHILLFWCFLHKPFFLDFSRLPELFLLAEDTRMVKPQHTRGWVARALICTKVLRPEDSALYWSSCTPCQIASSLCTFVPALWLDQWDLARPPSPLRSHPGSSCPSLTWACHCSHPYLPWGLGPVYFHIPSIQHIVSLPLFVGWMKDTFIRSVPPLASHKACTFTCLQSTKVSPIKANISTAKIYVS